jgi:DNA end-binding protein Ku
MCVRPLWKGFITFGLVSIPVRLYPATETKGISFSLLHRRCGTPVHYHKYCDYCKEDLKSEEIVKGFEFSKGRYVTFTAEEMDELPKMAGREIAITDFVDLAEVDPIYYQKTYYLAPAEGGDRAYNLLLAAMAESGRVAVAKVVLRTKENIAALRVYKDNTLAMSTIFFPEEIRSTAGLGLPEAAQPDPREIKMAHSLIDSLTAAFEPGKYQDTYRQMLNEVIEKKITNQKIEVPPERPRAEVIDLTEALRLSLEKITGEKPAGKPKKRVKAGAGT